MTHEQAMAEVERRQRSDPAAKWIATKQGEEWAVARIGVQPSTVHPTATTIKPPPATPHDDPQSALQRVANQFGAFG
jgi:hypothetical protein